MPTGSRRNRACRRRSGRRWGAGYHDGKATSSRNNGRQTTLVLIRRKMPTTQRSPRRGSDPPLPCLVHPRGSYDGICVTAHRFSRALEERGDQTLGLCRVLALEELQQRAAAMKSPSGGAMTSNATARPMAAQYPAVRDQSIFSGPTVLTNSSSSFWRYVTAARETSEALHESACPPRRRSTLPTSHP
jgi:hypothetical protein